MPKLLSRAAVDQYQREGFYSPIRVMSTSHGSSTCALRLPGAASWLATCIAPKPSHLRGRRSNQYMDRP